MSIIFRNCDNTPAFAAALADLTSLGESLKWTPAHEVETKLHQCIRAAANGLVSDLRDNKVKCFSKCTFNASDTDYMLGQHEFDAEAYVDAGEDDVKVWALIDAEKNKIMGAVHIFCTATQTMSSFEFNGVRNMRSVLQQALTKFNKHGFRL